MKKLLFTLLLAAATLPGWADDETQLTIIGGATSAGWCNDENTRVFERTVGRMVRTAENVWVWVGTLTAGADDAGRFKITNGTDKDSWNGYWAPSQNKEVGRSDSEVHDLSTENTNNRDWKFQVIATAMYRITVDLSQSPKKMKVEKLTEPSKDGDYYQLSSVDDFMWFAGKVTSEESSTAKAKLTADISFSDKYFFPLACEKHKFQGELDGNGHSIALDINSISNYQALVAFATGGATIKNLILKGSVTSTGSKTAGFIAEAKDGGTVTITNCGNEATISGGGGETAAIIANNFGGNCILHLTNIYNKGSVSGTGDVSTICGSVGGKDHIFSNIYNVVIPTTTSGDSGALAIFARTTFWDQNTFGTYNGCYSINRNSNDNSQILTFSTSDLTSGKLCYLLNGGTVSGNGWYQTLAGIDSHPYPFDTHKQVYQVSETFYTNIPVSDGKVQISNANDLVTFSAEVNAGNTALNAVLTEDIDMNGVTYTPIGSSDNKYAGEFDGSGYSITLGIDNGVYENQGLFGQATDGTNIHDLIVKGSVKGKKHVAGVLGSANAGHIQMTNVINAANINATADEEFPDAAGLVGTVNGSTYITLTRCGNAGKVTGKSNCAALCAWSNNSGSNKSSYTDCWNIGTIGSIESNAQLYRNSGNEVVTASGCYDASTTTNRGQGNLLSANAGTSGELCYKLNGNQNNIIWYQTIGTDTYPILSNTHKQVYQVSESAYTNLTVVEGKVQINNADDLKTFSAEVNAGNTALNAVLTGDIDMFGVNDYTPIGTDNNRYVGTFDGKGFRVKNLVIDNDKKEQGLFSVCAGATIQNLIMDATCSIKSSTNANGCAAFVAVCNGSGTLSFINCGNEANVTVTGSGASNAAFLGVNWCNNGAIDVSITNCYNTGDIKQGARNCAFIGWNSESTYTITNCYNIGTIENVEKDNNSWGRSGGTNTITNCYTTRYCCELSGLTSSYSSDKVTSGELCAKLGYAFRQNIGSGYPCFDQAQGFVTEIKDAGWSTQYITTSDVTIPSGIEAFAGVVNNAAGTITLAPISEKIKAGEPVILRGNAGLYNFVPTTGAGKAASNSLSGSDGTVSGGENIYALAKIGEEESEVVGFYPVGDGVKIPEGKAYLQYTGSNPVKGFTFAFDDDATGISLMEDGRSQMEDGAIYNLAGQRINKMQKGINIVNGKKILK